MLLQLGYSFPNGNEYLCQKNRKLARKIKLIWDFRGPEALEIAKHHCVHLKEFSEKENLTYHDVSTDPISEMYCIAYIVVNEHDMITFRDALKPHRGEVEK